MGEFAYISGCTHTNIPLDRYCITVYTSLRAVLRRGRQAAFPMVRGVVGLISIHITRRISDGKTEIWLVGKSGLNIRSKLHKIKRYMQFHSMQNREY
jgi:hypothetical protein